VIRSTRLPQEKAGPSSQPARQSLSPGKTPKRNPPANRVPALPAETHLIGIARPIVDDENDGGGVPAEGSRPEEGEEAVNKAAAGSPHAGVRDPDGPGHPEITVRK